MLGAWGWLVLTGFGLLSESLTFINEFGVQTSTRYFLGLKSSMFIPTSDIHDVVINEVICDVSCLAGVGRTPILVILKGCINCALPFQLKVIYFLIIRTKGRLYKTKPIIPLFEVSRFTIK